MFQNEISKLKYSSDNLIRVPKKIINNLNIIFEESKKTEIKFIKKKTSNLLNDNEKQTLDDLINSYTYSNKMETKIRSLKRINTIQYKFRDTNVNLFLYNSCKNRST